VHITTPFAEVVAGFDGFVAKYMGDGVLIYFGYPRAHEDDAERAVRAGLGVADAVGRLDVKSVKLQARVGIATGLVVVGDLIGEGSAQEQSVVGETPNLAARLQALAEPNAVVIAAGPRRLVGDLFECRDLGAVEVKGIAGPLPAWQWLAPERRRESVRGPARIGSNPSDRPRTRKSICYCAAGRAPRRATARWCWSRANPASANRASRRHCGARPYRATSPLALFLLAYHQDSALYPFIDQLGRAAEVAHDDSPASRLRSSRLCSPRAAPPTRMRHFLGDLLSLPASERHPLPNLSPKRKKERTLGGADPAAREFWHTGSRC